MESEWREAVLDVLAQAKDVVVFAHLSCKSVICAVCLMKGGFSSSILRKSVIEFATPPLDQLPSVCIPDLSAAKEEPVNRWINLEGKTYEEIVFEKVDSLLAYRPATLGAKWYVLIDVTS